MNLSLTAKLPVKCNCKPVSFILNARDQSECFRIPVNRNLFIVKIKPSGSVVIILYHTADRNIQIQLIQHFQCKRMSSLFKDVAEDGTVTYSDVNRVQLINKESPDIPFRNGFGTRLIDKMYPITLPYFPTDKKFKIIVEEFLTDEKNGDFDTVGYLQLILPNGEVVDLNGYFKDGPDGMIRIEQAEYEERKARRIDKK